GRRQVREQRGWEYRVLLGRGISPRRSDDPDLLRRLPVGGVRVGCVWMRQMFEPYYGGRVAIWAAGIDTARWQPGPDDAKDLDVLVYDKVRWEHERYERELITPILESLRPRRLRFEVIRYRPYREEAYWATRRRVLLMVLLCEHETQGFAYLQALSSGVPIFAWDRGGLWRDPAYHPHRVRFGPVTSVPYWDARCGLTFADTAQYQERLDALLARSAAGQLDPRADVLETPSPEGCAHKYL